MPRYLAQITGANLEIMRENEATALNGIAIYVGQADFSERHLQAGSTLGEEERATKTQGSALILAGGHPRGTLYAAHHFLEDVGSMH